MMNEIYYGQFQDVNSALWTVRIYKEGYSGDTTELTLADDPIVINYEDDGDVFKPVIYSQCTIKVLTNKILNIYSKNVFDVKIEVYKGDELYWFGYNTPNVYSSDYWSNLDEIEINAIDSLAALKYINYEQIILHNTLEVDLNYIRKQMQQSGEDYHKTYTYGEGNFGDIILHEVNGSVFGYSIFLKIEYFGTNFQIQIIENSGGTDLYYISGNTSTKIFDSIPNVESQIEKIYGSDGVQWAKIKIITPNTKWKYFPPNHNKVYYTKTPLTVRSFDILLNHVLTYVVPVEKVIYYNSLNNFDPSILSKIKISENIFYDEENEALKLDQVIEEICKLLNCRLIQWKDTYYLYNPEEYAYNYFKTANNDVYRLTLGSSPVAFYQDNFVKEIEIAENTSQVEMNDVYSEFKVQSTKKNVVENIINEEPKITEYSVTQEAEETVGDYKYLVNRTKGQLVLPPKGIELIQTQWSWNKNEKFPTPSPENYMLWEYSQLNNAVIQQWATYGYQSFPLMKTINPQTCFQGHVGFDRYIVLNMDLMISRSNNRPYGITREDSDHVNIFATGYWEEPILNRHGVPLLFAELRIGDKYWDGTSWENTKVGFQLYFVSQDAAIKEDNWYSLGNTISFNQKFKEQGYLITLPANVDFNGYLEFKIYRTHPSNVTVAYPDDPSQLSNYTWSQLVANPSLLDGTVLGISYNCYKDSCYYKLKNIQMKYIFKQNNNEEIDNNDIVYGARLNDNNYNVYKKKDMRMLFNSHNFEMTNKESYSEAFFDNNLLLCWFDKGLNIRPEQILLNRYENYYQEPRLIHSNTFKLKDITPISTLKINYLNNKLFIIGSCEIDVKYQTISGKFYEI